jgi:hypothetical protein
MSNNSAAKANRSGNRFRDYVFAIASVHCVAQKEHVLGKYGIDGKEIRVDVFIPEIQLAIEARYQRSSGSTDQKIWYLADNIKARYECDTLIVVDGSEGVKWVERLQPKVGGNLRGVFSTIGFINFCMDVFDYQRPVSEIANPTAQKQLF